LKGSERFGYKKYVTKANDLFGSKAYFDKQATIDKYFSLVDEAERPQVESFDELYEIALKYVEKQNFNAYTEDIPDYFHELSNEEALIAIGLGIVSFGLACVLDAKGNDIEKSIDNLLPPNYDVNNAFDLMKGKGHRIFGHDIPTFGLKNIPADFIVQVKDGVGGFQYAKLGDYLGIAGQDTFSMWDIIWVFYGNKGTKLKSIMNCLGHIIAHFGKDIFTPDGLPLPFTSLFNKFTQSEEYDGFVLKYKNSFAQKLDTRRIFMKASDFATVILIEAFIEFYCSINKTDDMDGFRHDMKLLAMGTCISLQLATILVGEGIQAKKKVSRKLVPGGKVNVLMSGIFFKLTLQEMTSIVKARTDINRYYDEIIKGEDEK
jgi:hypothetical protein